MLERLKSRYQWNNPELQKKNKTYNVLMLICAVLVLVCLYGLPQELKWVNMVLLVAGASMWYMAYRAQSEDRKLKRVVKK